MRLRAALTLLLALPLVACGGAEEPTGDPNALGTPSESPQPSTRTARPAPDETDGGGRSPSGDPADLEPRVVRTVAEGLQAPWGIVFLPDGSALVSERDTTRVVAVSPSGRVRPVGTVDEAAPQGEAGLLGLAASPTYDEDGLVFAYVSTADDNRVVTMTYDGRELGEPDPVLTGIPNGFIHDGGRLLFDDEGMLFVSTGEIGEPELAQDPDSLGGKILRITPDGDPAPGNPVPGSPVWTLGHRNVQGLALDDRDRLWATEFGQQTWDELNRIERARNYGWPVVEGSGEQDEYRNPFVEWSTAEASPSGLAFLEGSLWAGALRGERLWQVPVTGDGVGEPRGWFVGDYGRIRTVAVSPQGTLWVTTSNRDGRGEPQPGDDRILELDLR
ncbi:PQQ-dependent sugar dehydrogenase [Nocardioides sp. HDW12B]|uniref:PQQ-dependent sugar dehydrogenase n=1 Tax=Nocardioides sp. HDW12B TaxID=2714939 RepID=UPI0014086EFB|nr:PQQ-dependent sugar dehydrogenase [Nocardioides sp. HDW12B]QIK67056.1 PQQ-dependent sugar dehydrogenase [Nocardioides sp. HDW12B]